MFRLSLWDRRRVREADRGFTEQAHRGSEHDAFRALVKVVDNGEATLGQLLTEDGLVLKNYARPRD